MKFIVTDTKKRTIVVEAASFFDARQHAPKLMAWSFPTASDVASVEPADPDAVVTHELEWRGTDAGRVQNRFLWVRTRVARGWTQWERAT